MAKLDEYINKYFEIFKQDNNLSQSPLKKKKNIVQSLLYQIKSEFSLEEKERKDEDINNDIIFTIKMKNLLDIPKFQPHDIFHLFFKYNNNDKYKIGEVLDEKATSIGKISDKIIKLLDKKFKDAKDITNEIGCFLYEEITGAEI